MMCCGNSCPFYIQKQMIRKGKCLSFFSTKEVKRCKQQRTMDWRNRVQMIYTMWKISMVLNDPPKMVAIIGSSVLFGVFHLFSGNIIQMLMTTCIGAFFCFCRLKVKNCSTLSLIIGHGVYDALITVWASALL